MPQPNLAALGRDHRSVGQRGAAAGTSVRSVADALGGRLDRPPDAPADRRAGGRCGPAATPTAWR